MIWGIAEAAWIRPRGKPSLRDHGFGNDLAASSQVVAPNGTFQVSSKLGAVGIPVIRCPVRFNLNS
jgi:hypothetical protein